MLALFTCRSFKMIYAVTLPLQTVSCQLSDQLSRIIRNEAILYVPLSVFLFCLCNIVASTSSHNFKSQERDFMSRHVTSRHSENYGNKTVGLGDPPHFPIPSVPSPHSSRK
ncbi:hypothetical protein B0H63DRAFT_476271 [Podospora didyma]|uniref:Uncharacterized protein n=1 Tax=Podospora didyma TaxID=330526 RepID=A0AAE0NHL6_9PEZI|nr:hypothetical protein B0H63DRAFT_476271 [Podospora didyma]